MNLKEYVDAALVTENEKHEISVDVERLELVMQIYIAAGNMLDQYKKNIFYNKPFNTSEMYLHINKICDNAPLLGLDIPFADYNKCEVKTLDINPRILHGIIGKATESTELMEAIIGFSGNYDIYNICEEIGDDCWYTAILTDALQVDWSNDILQPNIDKLKARYGDKFTEESAIHRNLDVEREILETADVTCNNDGC